MGRSKLLLGHCTSRNLLVRNARELEYHIMKQILCWELIQTDMHCEAALAFFQLNYQVL